MINQEQVRQLHAALRKDASIFSSNIIFRDTVQSTQDALVDVADSAPDGTVWLTHNQQSGRGRHGRVWLSPPGSLTFSVLIRPDMPPHRAGTLMMASAISLYNVLRRYTPDTRIKWPNDIIINGKVAGVIIDTAISDIIEWAVIGVGVNVSIDTRVMSGIDTVSNHTKHASAYDILLGFLRGMNQYRKNVDNVQELYTEKCSTIGSMVHYGDIQGLATGIDSDGALIVHTGKGMERVTTS